jgi:hypothetical protein
MIKSWLVFVWRDICVVSEGPVVGVAGEASGSDRVVAVIAWLVPLFRPRREVLEADIRPVHIGQTARRCMYVRTRGP